MSKAGKLYSKMIELVKSFKQKTTSRPILSPEVYAVYITFRILTYNLQTNI